VSEPKKKIANLVYEEATRGHDANREERNNAEESEDEAKKAKGLIPLYGTRSVK